MLFVAEVVEGVLQVKLNQQQFLPVFPESKTRFFYRVVKAEIEFELKDGKATQLTLLQGGRKMPARRVE